MRFLFFTGIAFLFIVFFTVLRSMIAIVINSHSDLGLFVLLILICVIIGAFATLIYDYFN